MAVALAAQVHGGSSGTAASGFVITDDVVWRSVELHRIKHER